MLETVVSISSVSCTLPSKVFALARFTHGAARHAMPAREMVLLAEMPNRYRQKKMGETPIIFLPVVAPEPRRKPHAQRLCKFSIFHDALQSNTRAKAPEKRRVKRRIRPHSSYDA